MRILQVVPYYYPSWRYGGPGKLVRDTSEYFAKQGHQVVVVTSDAYSTQSRMPNIKRRQSARGMSVLYLPLLSNYLAHALKIFITPSFLWHFPQQFFWAEVVHLHDFFTPQHWLAGMLCIAFKKPLIISVHGTLETTALQQQKFLKRSFLFCGGSFILRRAHVVASSPSEQKQLPKLGIKKSRLHFIQHGVSAQEHDSTVSKQVARKKLALNSRGLVITYLGRLHQLKGIDLLLKAIVSLNNSSLTFVIAGSDDGYLAEIKKAKQSFKMKNLHLFGPTFGKKKQLLFKATDIFVYPSRSEGFSIGILEALSVGLPSIITTACNFPQAKKAKAALVVKPNSNQITHALRKLIASKKQRTTLSKTAKIFIQDHYSPAAVSKELLNLYSSAQKI